MSAHVPTPKELHYKSQVSSILTSGAWDERTPGKAYNGVGMDWGETMRKWVKHTGGNPALVQPLQTVSSLYLFSTPSSSSSSTFPQSTTSSPLSIASQPYPHSQTSGTSGSFVNIPRPSADLSDAGVGASVDSPDGDSASQGLGESPASTIHPSAGLNTIALGTVIKADGTAEGGSRKGKASVEQQDRDLSADGGWFKGVPKDRRVEVEKGLKDVEGALGSFKGSDRRSALLLLAYHLHALSRHSEALKVLEGVEWSAPVKDSRGWSAAVEAVGLIRGRAVEGLCFELTNQPEDAVKAYTACAALFSQFTNTTQPTLHHTFLHPSPQPPSIPLPSFTAYKEAHRWLSTSLYRATLLSARTADLERTMRFLRTYALAGNVWPAGWKKTERGVMLDLYLRGLKRSFVPFPAAHPVEGHQWFLLGSEGKLGQGKGCIAELWVREVKEAMSEGKGWLERTSEFPRAGEVNDVVERFLGDCVGLWERGGRGVAQGKEVVAILWWGMTLTFHSQFLLRELTRLLQATGSSADARRTFELYVGLVLKARQTEHPERALELRKGVEEGEVGVVGEEVKREVRGEDPVGGEGAGQEGQDAERAKGKGKGTKIGGEKHDSDEEFVETLLLGARILTRDLAEPMEAWRYIVLAGEVIGQSEEGVGRELRGRVEEGKGVVRMAMAVEDKDPVTRPKWQRQGIQHLVIATELNPTSSSTFYHLALAQAEIRDIDSSIASIQSALELDGNNVESWHLLAQLQTANKDWEGALKAVGVGIETWEAAEEAILRSSPAVIPTIGGNPDAKEPTINEKDFAETSPSSETETPTASTPTHESQLIFGQAVLEDSKTTTPFIPPITASKRLETVIQLKITQAAIIEKLYGATEAMTKQQESFHFFSARSGYKRLGGEGTESVKSSSVRDLSASFVAVVEAPAGANAAHGESMMTVTPATPDVEEKGADSAFASNTTANDSPGASDVEGDGESTIQRRKRKLLPKHLHVPSIRRPGRASSLSLRPKSAGDPQDLSIQRARTISNGSSVYSQSVTPAHSHYHGASSPPAAPPPMTKSIPTGRTAAETRVLASLWLLSAAIFRRNGKIAQALGAIQEAEVMDPAFAEIYVQLGLYHVEMQDSTAGLAAFNKALLLHPDYPPAVVNLAKLYLSLNQVDLAHELLNALTQTNGWDIPEAWYWLAKVCERQGGREPRVRQCLLEALGLEKGRTCRPLSVLTRWL